MRFDAFLFSMYHSFSQNYSTAFEEFVKWILTRLSFVRLFSNSNQQRVWKKLKKSFLEEEGVD